ncbi:DUF2804 domain-containing protein [Sphingobacteriales bacterium UPWRP_1]|nr:hypothetical protein BVG80_14965 [Sphingobacteriales bacterium TSM_CSM]PSJ79050.1 DUF2804 domain-containing protein [Sphingobacteriales bacterium UPWRP_1]
MTYNRKLQTPPAEVVNANGRFNFGCYNAPFTRVNLLNAQKPYALPLPRFAKNLQLREWQAFQITNGRYFVMVAIYNAKKMALVQFIVYDKEQNKKWRYEKKVAPFQLQLAQGLYNTQSGYQSNNFTLAVHNHLEQERFEITARIKDFDDLPNLEANFTGFHTAAEAEPLVSVLPFAQNRGMYTHKCLMPAQGTLLLDGVATPFNRQNSAMIIDDHKGYYPYPTRYDWVTALGHTPEGILLGFNLTRNQALNPEQYNENCLWYNGKITTLPPIAVQRPNGVQNTWYIKDRYGMVDLSFTPVAHTSVNINLLLLHSRYEGPYGFFNGYIQHHSGNKIAIDQLFGMGEQFYLRA